MVKTQNLVRPTPLDGSVVPRSFDRSSAAQQRAHSLVPHGAHTYGRGSDKYPGVDEERERSVHRH
jgi:hypothetical protein